MTIVGVTVILSRDGTTDVCSCLGSSLISGGEGGSCLLNVYLQTQYLYRFVVYIVNSAFKHLMCHHSVCEYEYALHSYKHQWYHRLTR